MKIRSVTAFSHLGPPLDLNTIPNMAGVATAAKKRLEDAGYEVQSTRLASNPISSLAKGLNEQQAIELAKVIEASALDAGFGYISLGPVLAEDADMLPMIVPILANTQVIFLSASLTSADHRIYPEAIKGVARLIRESSTLEANGFANLRLAALANVDAGSPFFPAAYQLGPGNSFAFATQAADLAVTAFESVENIDAGLQQLTKAIEQHGQILGKIGQAISEEYAIAFGGIDFSLAPFPEDSDSLGKAMELMAVARVGMHGTLTAVALLTSAIQAADFPRTGFNGLLLPPLEDSILAERAADGSLSVDDLLLYSAVCGTGLDTVPLPGEIAAETIEAILMDVAALALRLDKPLTARLMPIPGKVAGDETNFDFAFFANSRVMAVQESRLNAALKASSPFRVPKR